ncbi:hypothetical protein VTH06DRAFT_1844 [Thermothelomyces fergusii]
MTNTPLLKETAVALRTLCSSCGLPKTGTKPVLVQRLRRAAGQFRPVPPEARILSIDLGLKNFAYALLSPAAPPGRKRAADGLLNVPVHLHAWDRLDLTLRSHRPDATGKATASSASSASSSSASSSSASAKEKEDEEEKDKDGEAYSPAALSALTAHLVRTRLLPLRPTHVLIERQRFRNRGGAAVTEWTLRVNSLEAMLHAALAALRGVPVPTAAPPGSGSGGDGGDLVWDGPMCSVLPRTVVGFLFPAGGDDSVPAGEEDGEQQKGKTKKAMSI